MTERSYPNLSELIDCLTAARTLGLRNVTVSSHFHPVSTDGDFMPASWEYHVTLTEEDGVAFFRPDGTAVTDTEAEELFGNGPTHLHLGDAACRECAWSRRNIYLASRFGNAASLRLLRDELEKQGHKVTSTWIDVPITEEEDARRDQVDVDPAERSGWAVRDIDDLRASDTFVLIDPSGRRGGCYVELGYALALDLDCYIVGQRTNVFTYLATRAANITDLLTAFEHEAVSA